MTATARRPLKVGLTSEATMLGHRAHRLAPGLEVTPVKGSSDAAALAPLLAGCVAVVAGPEPYRRELLTALPALCLIARPGVGYDQIDLVAADELGIHVTVTRGVNAQVVAEHALGLTLATLHRVRHHDLRVRDGRWRDGSFFRELHGSTVGIVGFGQIGRSFCRLLRPFDVRVLVHDVVAISDHQAEVTFHSDLRTMLPLCDVLSLHVPLNDQTRGMLGVTELGLLPRGAVVVNTSRGGIIDEIAMADALKSGHLAGAALDVFEAEPPPVDHVLLSIDNCLVSPHIASFGSRTVASMTDLLIEQINAVAAGRTPPGLVNAPLDPRFPENTMRRNVP
jgi:D-3-phosphoglycerate dehydrogenase